RAKSAASARKNPARLRVRRSRCARFRPRRPATRRSSRPTAAPTGRSSYPRLSPRPRNGAACFFRRCSPRSRTRGRARAQRRTVRASRAAARSRGVKRARAARGHMLVVDELPFDGDRPRAREVLDWLGRVGHTGRALLVTAETNEHVGRATANLKEFEIRTPGTLRLTDVLRAETVLVLRPALDALAARATVATVERAD